MAFSYYSPISINANGTFYSPISINSGQVPSTQTDFPVLVSFTDARFKTIANGGRVQNSNGYDIRPYSDSGLTTAITGYELERYNASTGEVVMWVKIASLSSSTTPIYLSYGDSSITTDGSSTTTWSNGFLGVYHFKDGTTLNVNSATGSNNGTNNGATATTGQIDGAASFASASAQYITCGNGMNPSAMTITGWVKGTTFPNAYNTVAGRIVIGQQFVLYVKSNGKLACYLTGSGSISYDGTGSHTLSTGTIYHLAMTYDSSAGLIGYVNAASDGTAAANGPMGTSAATFNLSKDEVTTGRNFNGWLDEIRAASTARSANWITTEYNNQSAPGTFMTLGTEVNLGTVPSTQTDFPVLVSVTDARFKTVGNGGHVQNSSGFDIRPYTDTTLGTAITGYELERYNASTGELIMWVKVASLSSGSTPFVLAYGDTGITTDGSSTTTWSNNFLGVYHLKDGTTLNVNSSTGSNNGTNHSVTAAAGQIDGCGSFASASSQYVDIGNFGPTSITLSAWINATSFPNSYNGIITRPISGTNNSSFYVKSNGKMHYYVANGASSIGLDGTGSNTLSSSTWYYVCMVFSNILTTGALKGYVNGAQDNSGNIGAAFSLNSVANQMFIGADLITAGTYYFNGKIDEARVASAARSADWITTEYNNQNAPGTFETLGTEVALTVASTGNMFLLFP